MKSFTFPSGSAYVEVRSTRPDPASRYSVVVHNAAQTSSQGLIDLGKFLIECGKDYAKIEREELREQAPE
jgi:hypothetical protein